MLLRRRVVSALVLFGLLAAAGLLLTRSHAQATNKLTFAGLNPIQRRLISQPLATALGAPPSNAAPINGNENGGGDGLPNTPPASYESPGASGGGSGSSLNYFPSPAGKCSANLGDNVKVNQNCLNITDRDLQGRGQANNETSIAQDPFNTDHIVASDNNYIRGDGGCGAHFSIDGGRTWGDSVVPNSFTRYTGKEVPGASRQYWQASGDTSVAWDTHGNAYLSCQVFNRGAPPAGPTSSPDLSSAFLLFRSTGNAGASWNFPGRYSTTVFFDATGSSGGAVLEDKALMTVDNNVHSPYRDRIYVTWTEFAADGTAYIYETHSDDYGETFSKRVLVSADSPFCTNTFGAATPNGNKCNENQFSDPFVGPDGNLYVVWDSYNNQPTTGTDNRYQVLLAKSTDGGDSFSAPVKVSDYYDLPDCDTYQGAGADPFRACVPEKGSSTKSVFRATNYPSGAVDPRDSRRVTIAFGSYINRDSNESNGCVPAGFAADGNPTYTGVKTAGACNNKILVSFSDNAGNTFTGTAKDPRDETVVPQSPAQKRTDQFWQWSAYTRSGQLAVDYYDRQYGKDESNGSSDFSLSGSHNLVEFGQSRVTSSSMPAPTEFPGPKGGQFFGDYTGLAAVDQAHPLWMDTRAKDLFVCPGTAMPGKPPQLCGGVEPNGQVANDEEIYTATLNVPNGRGRNGR